MGKEPTLNRTKINRAKSEIRLATVSKDDPVAAAKHVGNAASFYWDALKNAKGSEEYQRMVADSATASFGNAYEIISSSLGKDSPLAKIVQQQVTSFSDASSRRKYAAPTMLIGVSIISLLLLFSNAGLTGAVIGTNRTIAWGGIAFVALLAALFVLLRKK